MTNETELDLLKKIRYNYILQINYLTVALEQKNKRIKELEKVKS